MKKGLVYFIKNGFNEVKIGFTRQKIEKRIQQLQRPDAKLICCYNTQFPRKLEKMLHIKFKDFLIGREWFALENTQKQFLIELCDEFNKTIITEASKPKIIKTPKTPKSKKAKIKENKWRILVKDKAYIEKCLNKIFHLGYLCQYDVIKDIKNKSEQSMYYKLYYLLNVHTNNPKEAVELLRQIGLSTRAWNSFKTNEAIEYLKKTNNQTDFMKAIYNEIEVGEKYDAAKINEIVNKISKEIYTNKTLSIKKTTIILKNYFKVKRVSTREDGKIVKKLLIESTEQYDLFKNEFKVKDSEVEDMLKYLG